MFVRGNKGGGVGVSVTVDRRQALHEESYDSCHMARPRAMGDVLMLTPLLDHVVAVNGGWVVGSTWRLLFSTT